jgi:hypothetical protein
VAVPGTRVEMPVRPHPSGPDAGTVGPRRRVARSGEIPCCSKSHRARSDWMGASEIITG